MRWRRPFPVEARARTVVRAQGSHRQRGVQAGQGGAGAVDPDPRLRRILERHLDDLVRPAVLHEKVRRRVFRQLRKELADIGVGWWRRRRAVRAVRREVRRIRREPGSGLDLSALDVLDPVFQGLLEVLQAAL